MQHSDSPSPNKDGEKSENQTHTVPITGKILQFKPSRTNWLFNVAKTIHSDLAHILIIFQNTSIHE